ncbi:SDR family NAD(P)-dependent oxidoreductase [Altericroceibacterium spongiae]|uniref:SDR family NAD(P)-dependent oxidoreductase n=1 Tax=Altericroceibacterium spongiae TaxID=2320269 RepID=A0A420ECH3_9SPHN|nr:SDR family NAD(P)-dependent oxidoreductase [Altericroceibacterium spongiae]RKF18332.1 SDR family NAD(P)-dependent oxidoreductase [Altericroceibacterium spongiae]
MINVNGKTAFITGGASGMGLGMAKAFAAAGMKVVIADIRQEALDEAMEEFANTNLAVYPVRLDVTDRDGWVKAVEEAEQQYGNLHVLALNAGVGITGPMSEATYKDWDFNIQVNLYGVVNGLVTVLPRMKAHGEECHVVATSSTGGFSAVGSAGLYCTAKFAVAGMMESLATELDGSPIGVSCFFPGPVTTNLGISTGATRPDHLRNEDNTAKSGTKSDAPKAPPPFDTSVFMSKEEVGKRVLRGIQRGDLFIMTHPEFTAGIKARNDALLRAQPVEPRNEERADVVAKFGTLLYNPIYDKQDVLDGPPLT